MRISMPPRLFARIILMVLFIMMFAVSMQGQSSEFWAFLGASETNVVVKQTPVYNISYQANGFDGPRKNRVRKTIARMQSRGATHLIEDFDKFAHQMTRENAIPRWIDEAYGRIVERWLSVGDHTLEGARMSCAEAVRRFNPSSLLVIVEETPFQVQGYPTGFYVAGTTDGRIIRALNVNADGFMSDPQHARLRTFDLLVSWELGNSLALFAGYVAKTLDQEIGDHVPDRW
jgi:hypothetical protein